TKFRDEPRPRAGLIRGREFIMKDMYSFHRRWDCLDKYYERVYDAYTKLFKLCGLKTRAVLADSGPMGGDVCHEFMVESSVGEDTLFVCRTCDTGWSSAVAKYHREDKEIVKEGLNKMEEVSTPDVKTIEQLTGFLKKSPHDFIKAIVYKSGDLYIMGLVRGDHDINEAHLKSALGVKGLEMAAEADIEKITGAPMGFSGPVGVKNIKVVADKDIKSVVNAVIGANKKDTHFINANIDRDFKVDLWADIRVAVSGDLCPECRVPMELKKGIELGHIFKLGTKYSDSLKAHFVDEDGAEKPLIMGCYGVGISRIVAAVIEQYNDKDGIIWPMSLAPYKVAVIPVIATEKEQMDLAMDVYNMLRKEGIDCLLDDRDLRPGVKFKDIDLMGIPVKIVIGVKTIKEGKLEVKTRKDGNTVFVDKEKIIDMVREIENEQIKVLQN
ncbi:MAG: proline--tRNA ligase, partial [Armatimonadota bacterium]